MTIKEGLLRDILRLIIWYPFRWLVSVVPVSTAFSLLTLLGTVHSLAGGGKKQQIESGLKRALGADAAEAGAFARRNLENHYIDRLHILLYPRLRAREVLARHVRFENPELLSDIIKGGRGALIVQPHFGPVQLTLLALALHGFNPLQIGYLTDSGLSRIGKGVAYRLRAHYEALLPAPIIPANGYLGSVVRHLRAAGVVLTTGDGAGGGVHMGEHRELEFLGSKRALPLGPASLAIRTGAAFVPTFIVTESPSRFRVVFEPPIEPKYGERDKDALDMTERFVEVAERYIRKYPESWHFWDEVDSTEAAKG